MTIAFLLKLIWLAATPAPQYQPPTWENLLPWMFGFFAAVVSSLLYFFTHQQTKAIEELKAEVKKMANAVYLGHRARLVQMATDPNIHPLLKEQCEIMVKEIDTETGPK